MGKKSRWTVNLRACLALLVGLFAACGKFEPKPVAIETWDACHNCKMAISEKRYAAEFVDQEGVAFKFDDVACMIRYQKNRQQKSPILASYVVDFESPDWLKAEEAFYVRST